MKEDDQGVWEVEINKDLHGTYYDFTIHGSDAPGNHFFDTNPVHSCPHVEGHAAPGL